MREDEIVEHIATKVRDPLSRRIEELEERQVKFGAELKKGGTMPGFGSPRSLGELAVAEFKKAGLDATLEKGSRKTVVVKASGTMTTGNIIPGIANSVPFTLSDRESGLARVVRRKPFIIEIANVRPTDKGYVQWAEQTNPDGAAGQTAEGTLKNKVDFDWQEKSAKVEKTSAFVKISKEALDDVDSMRSEIDVELREVVLLAADNQLLNGNGTSPQLNGLLNQDTAYDAGAFAGSVDNANRFDVLRTAISQVVVENFSPTHILLNPIDAAKMDLAKSDFDEHYVLPPFRAANGQEISGVQILESTAIAEGSFTVGDFRLFNVRVREGFTVSVGFENDDFTKNLVTILGELRLVSYVKSVHQKAFVTGNFDDAISALQGS